MNYKPYKSLQVLVAMLLALAAASAQAAGVDTRFGKAGMIKPVAVATSLRDKDVRRLVARNERESFSPLALTEERLDDDGHFGRNVVRLYPIGNGEANAEGSRASPPSQAGKDAASASAASKLLLPEPGSWAMFLAGLLGVGAIARRRMSA